MNIQEFRATMADALRQEGLVERRLFPRGPKVWVLNGGDIVRFFWPQAIRRSWGFIYDGAIGIEIPSLRRWLTQFKPEAEASIFRQCFVSYLIINEDVFRDAMMVEHGKPVPSDLWAGLLKDRLEKIPTTLDALIASYRRNKEELGWLGHPHERVAWEFLLRWHEKPDPSMHVPQMLPNGQII